MKLTSLLLVETLSDSDYIMVYVGNVNCTVGIVPATLLNRIAIVKCIVNNLNVISDLEVIMINVNQKQLCQDFNR